MFVTMLYNIWFLVLKNHISEPQEKETHHFILSRHQGHTYNHDDEQQNRYLIFCHDDDFWYENGRFRLRTSKRKIINRMDYYNQGPLE